MYNKSILYRCLERCSNCTGERREECQPAFDEYREGMIITLLPTYHEAIDNPKDFETLSEELKQVLSLCNERLGSFLIGSLMKLQCDHDQLKCVKMMEVESGIATKIAESRAEYEKRLEDPSIPNR